MLNNREDQDHYIIGRIFLFNTFCHLMKSILFCTIQHNMAIPVKVGNNYYYQLAKFIILPFQQTLPTKSASGVCCYCCRCLITRLCSTRNSCRYNFSWSLSNDWNQRSQLFETHMQIIQFGGYFIFSWNVFIPQDGLDH